MKKFKRIPVLSLCALVLILFGCVFGIFTENTASAASSRYSSYISRYDITYDIASNRKMTITEDMTVSYKGNRGFFKYIPTDAGELVKNLTVNKLSGGTEQYVYHKVSVGEDGLIEIEIDDDTVKHEEITYRIKYDYCLTKAQEGENLLALAPIGSEIPCEVENINLTFLLPQGYIKGSAKCFIYGGSEIKVNQSADNGRVKLTAHIDEIGAETEVRMDIGFAAGSLTTYTEPDFTPYIFIIVSAVILAVLLIFKFLCFNKDYLTPIVNYEAPNKMDPLLMGKLIDDRVNSEDVTSLIFYWADKGYLAINLDNKDDPVLIRKVVNLPESAQDYERVMFESLFRSGEAVKISSLKYSFYSTVDKVTAMVNRKAKNLYDTKSFALSIVFAVLGLLVWGGASLITAMLSINSTFRYLAGFIAVVPAAILYVLTLYVFKNKLKLKKSSYIAMIAGIAALGVVFSLFCAVIQPNYIIAFVPKLLLGLVSCGIIISSVILICRTKSYTEKLNDIVGFKNFITLSEKDRLEMLLEEDPQFYYHILPYAQVLGVTDKWEEKFETITVEPPSWGSGSLLHSYVEFRVVSGILNASMRSMTANMASRPSRSSGFSGFSGGGHGGFGGFSGGGHGGGGIRFK